MGEASPAAEVSCGYPGISVLDHRWPPSNDLYTLIQASPVSAPSGRPGTSTER